jgi:peptidoglycan hydrolase-like amidase
MKRIVYLVTLFSILLGTTTAFADHVRLANTSLPSSIRVAIREARPGGDPDPRGRIIYVKTVPFDNYMEDSLPNEWIPAWRTPALEAGAIAIKMFAWNKVLHPTTLDGWEFDLDNTTNFQTYREGNRYSETGQAYRATRNLAFTKADGTILEMNYRSGYQNDPNWQYRNANMMAQWGSQYWAEQGYDRLRILQWYYQGFQLQQIPGL